MAAEPWRPYLDQGAALDRVVAAHRASHAAIEERVAASHEARKLHDRVLAAEYAARRVAQAPNG